MKPAAMKNGKLYSQQPHSGAGDFNFSRANGVQTRINKHGLIETVANNEPRLSYSIVDGKVSDCPHLLLEPSRANHLTYSEFTNADPVGWTLGFGTGTYEYDLVSYRGRGALKQTQTTTGRSYQYQNVTLLASTTYTLSMYVDISNSNVTNIGEGIMHVLADDETGDNTAEWQDIDTNTGRVSITFTTGSDTSVQIRIGLGATGDTLSSNQVLTYSMPQLEVGSYATSYIPTSGSTEQRQTDICNSSGNSETFNDSEGVLYAEISALANDGTTREMAISDGGASNRIEVRYISSDNDIQVVIRGASSTIVLAYNVTDATEFAKVAVKYKSEDYALWVGGVERAVSATSGTPTGLNELAFDDGNGNFNMYGKCKQLIVFNEALTDEQLQLLTTP